MTKFKVGQSVRCIKGEDASGSGWKLGRVFTIKSIFNDKYCPLYCDSSGLGVFATHLEAVTKTIEDVEYQDIIENEWGKCKVLGRLNDVIFISMSNDFDKAGGYYTTSDLKEKKYKISQEEEEKMITIKGKEYSEETIHKSLKEYVK